MSKAPSKRRPGTQEDMHLNITSLIDVLTILLVFLLKSYSAQPEGNITVSELIELPTSRSQTQIEEQSTQVTITKQAILVDNEHRVAEIVEGWQIGGASEENPFKIAGLISRLEEVAEKQEYIAEHNPGVSFDGEILIQADRAMPSRVLAAVLYSVGQAGFDKIKLIAINETE